jgi:HEAT repeat protein
MLAGAVILLNGCNKGPILAGGKPVAHWVQALNDPDAKVRKAAAIKLGNVGPADATAFPALHNALHDGDADVRCEMILALVKFGRKAKEASASLDELRLHDPDAKVRDYAAKALAKFDQFP